MTDRAAANGDGIRWTTLAILMAVVAPLLAAAAGWGTLYAKVDNLTESSRRADERATRADDRARRSDEAVNSLNVSVAKLSAAVDALTQRIGPERPRSIP